MVQGSATCKFVEKLCTFADWASDSTTCSRLRREPESESKQEVDEKVMTVALRVHKAQISTPDQAQLQHPATDEVA